MNISDHAISQIPFDFWLAMICALIVLALVIFLISVFVKRAKAFIKKRNKNRQNEVVKHDLD